jgi:hypothetical protein
MTSMRPDVAPGRPKSAIRPGFTGRRGGSASEEEAIQSTGSEAIYYRQQHGGRIWEEGEPGQGARVVVELPLRPPERLRRFSMTGEETI